MSVLEYIGPIFKNLSEVDPQEVENVFHDLNGAGAIIPSGEGRAKGALSIACSEMAKMSHGKIIVDRSDIGFPGKDLAQAAPVLKRRHGHICLLINSSSGKSLNPILDAQKLGVYITTSGQARDFRIDLVTADPDSPLGKLSIKYGNRIILKGRRIEPSQNEPREFRSYGIMEDIFPLASGLLFHCMASAISQENAADKVLPLAKSLSSEISAMAEETVNSDFFRFLLDELEQRKACFFAGLGSSQEVARMTAVRIGHLKRAMGDAVYMTGETNTPPPRPGDILIAISHSGENEIVAGWCRNFKKMGGRVACIVGTSESTTESISDVSFVVKGDSKPGMPNDFYIKSAFGLSPLPIYLAERVEEKGFQLPAFIRRWQKSVVS